jgi:hypothetical protein
MMGISTGLTVVGQGQRLRVEGDLVGWRRLTFHLAQTASKAQDDNQQATP